MGYKHRELDHATITDDVTNAVLFFAGATSTRRVHAIEPFQNVSNFSGLNLPSRPSALQPAGKCG
jgi:hypothetical protein